MPDHGASTMLCIKKAHKSPENLRTHCFFPHLRWHSGRLQNFNIPIPVYLASQGKVIKILKHKLMRTLSTI